MTPTPAQSGGDRARSGAPAVWARERSASGDGRRRGELRSDGAPGRAPMQTRTAGANSEKTIVVEMRPEEEDPVSDGRRRDGGGAIQKAADQMRLEEEDLAETSKQRRLRSEKAR